MESYLTRRDPERNMARFYALEVAPDLFGGAVLVRHWGRIGTGGQARRQWFAAAAEARAEAARWRALKERRGYAAEGAPA
jgi:predicted DNA-binding WGR domain protein